MKVLLLPLICKVAKKNIGNMLRINDKQEAHFHCSLVRLRTIHRVYRDVKRSTHHIAARGHSP